jgi:hypothetical protein
VRESAEKAIRVMESSIGSLTRSLTPKIPCASCHHNILPQWVLKQAADHGLKVNEPLRRQVAIQSYGFLKDTDRAIQGTAFVDPSMEAAEFLAFGKRDRHRAQCNDSAACPPAG